MKPLLEFTGVAIDAPGGRPLFAGLDLQVSRERVALVGRNGVGKSTLLAVAAGALEARAGRVRRAGSPYLVPQMLDASRGEAAASSKGERRREALAAAFASNTDILLLDEPSEDLDDDGVAWLRERIARWEGCLLVASHDRRLLADFDGFFLVSESGCRALAGPLESVDEALSREHAESERRYARSLDRLAAREEHTERVAQRRARKKRRGRCKELDRATPRIRLNTKRGAAQVYQGKLSRLREARLEAVRQWTRSMRRALAVELPLTLPVPDLPEVSAAVLAAEGLSAHAGSRRLFESVRLELGRKRIAVVGPNGAGKTTLLEILLGHRPPSSGTVRRELARIGSIEQEGANWMRDEPLLALLSEDGSAGALEQAARILAVARFPSALAERPLRSLSPGERTRAALIALFRRAPAPEVLVLDEPTYSLDLVGQRAMTEALRAWPGGLLVASHDLAFLEAVGVGDWIRL